MGPRPKHGALLVPGADPRFFASASAHFSFEQCAGQNRWKKKLTNY